MCLQASGLHCEYDAVLHRLLSVARSTSEEHLGLRDRDGLVAVAVREGGEDRRRRTVTHTKVRHE